MSTNKVVAFTVNSRRPPNNERNEDFGSKNHNKFEVIFRKLVFVLRICGIPLNPSAMRANKSWILLYWSFGFGLISLTANVALNTYSVVVRELTIERLNVLINAANFAMAMPLVHAGLFRTALRWDALFSFIKRIEELDFYQPEDFKRFNRVVVVGSVIVLLVSSSAMCAGLILPIISHKIPGSNTILAIRAPAFTPFLCIAIVLCVIMGSIVVVMITILTERVTNIAANGGISNTGDVKLNLASSSVIQWKRCYYLIDGLVSEISHSFGFILLVLVTFNFIWIVTVSFLVVDDFKQLGYLSDSAKTRLIMVMMSSTLIYLTILILHRMKSKAFNLAYQLRALDAQDPAVHQKVNEMMMQILLSPPSVSMLGLVDADLRLIPAMVGTTLTYIIMMLQFATTNDDRH